MTASSGLSLAEARRDREFWGRVVESAVGAHLVNLAAAGLCQVFYWRDRNYDVDFVVKAGKQVTAIEVKSGRSRDSFPGLAVFVRAFPKARTLLVGDDMTPIERPDLYVGGGGALAFIRFLESELVPFIAARWPVSRRRILYGESYGGLLVLDAVARGGGVFTDYIAVSPAVGVWPEGLSAALRQRMAVGAIAAPPGERAGGPLSVFVVYGQRDAPLVTDFTPPVLALIANGRPPTWRLGADVRPGAGHNPPDALARGLQFVFESPGAESVAPPQDRRAP